MVPQSVVERIRLPEAVIAGVKYFTVFVGFGRSGSTLVGALLDAHPNIVLGTDYQLFLKWPEWPSRHRNLSYLYTALYQYSIKLAFYFRNDIGKGYMFNLKKGFNGRYNKSILVIGEKEAVSATTPYITDHQQWMQTLKDLQDTVKVPIKGVMVSRSISDFVYSIFVMDTYNADITL